MTKTESKGEILIYKSPDGMLGIKTPAISKHLKNIFKEGELKEEVVISVLETTTKHGAIKGKTQSKLVQKEVLNV